MVLKTLESPLDCKEIQPVHPKGDQTWVFFGTAAAVAKLLQLCPTLCDPIDVSPPGSAIPGILQVRTLEWVAIAFSSSLEGLMLKLKLQYFGYLM